MAIIDTQSTRTTEQGGPGARTLTRGIHGRKQHLIVDTLGLIQRMVVRSAEVQDRDGARSVLVQIQGRFTRLSKILADGIYNVGIAGWARQFGGRLLEIAPKPERKEGEPFPIMK
ncbi:MAG TPA: transposase [Isosphaeraceae bacterium]|nr:transposase [Isosphaeraceae bacterium]